MADHHLEDISDIFSVSLSRADTLPGFAPGGDGGDPPRVKILDFGLRVDCSAPPPSSVRTFATFLS